jgi:hypothetical protein
MERQGRSFCLRRESKPGLPARSRNAALLQITQLLWPKADRHDGEIQLEPRPPCFSPFVPGEIGDSQNFFFVILRSPVCPPPVSRTNRDLTQSHDEFSRNRPVTNLLHAPLIFSCSLYTMRSLFALSFNDVPSTHYAI